MAKSTKQLVASMNAKKELTKREISRKMDNLRKRLRTARNAIKKRIESGEFKNDAAMRRNAERYYNQIDKAIKNTYATKKGYKHDLQHYEDVVSSVSYRARNEIYVQVDKRNEDTVHSQDVARENLDIKKVMAEANLQIRKNLQFQRDMAQARIEDGVSQLSNLEVSAFYRATQSIWENENLINRNAAIMKHLGVTSLEEAFDIVLNDENVKKSLDVIRQLSGNVDDTKEKMAGKEKDEEDWKYKSSIIGIISRNTIKK